MTMIYGPISFVKFVQKIIMGICGKIFVINLHNLQMLFMMYIKYKFSEYLDPWAKMPADTGALGTSYPQIYLYTLNFLVLKKFVLNI